MRPTTRTLLLATSALVPLGLAPVAYANPVGASVAAGSAQVSGEGTANLTVNQATDKAIINWNTFNIGNGETTQFVQPSASSVTLNRVTGGLGTSQIDGALKANGNVFLINPDGILFGPHSVVDVGGLVATTNDIKNDDFMAGRYVFGQPGKADASVVNAGSITAATGGFAALVAPGVRNSGTISARLGKIGLAAANGFTLDFYGDQLLTLNVGDEIAGTVRDVQTGQTLDALVKNEGALKADGGVVQLTAAAARQVVDSVINTKGIIEANSVGMKNGKIVLSAATAGSKPAAAPTQKVKVSGKLSAAGKNPGETGGKVQITGEDIALNGVTIDASGPAGGGTVLVGGDVSGGHPNPNVVPLPKARPEATPVPTATNVSVDPTSKIDVSATDKGDGGKAIVWADFATDFAGTIYAKGGPNGGDGGYAETSGKQNLDFSGATIDTSASDGQAGTWLIDPTTLVIDPSLANTVSNNLRSTSVWLSATSDLYLAANITKNAGPDATLTFTAPFIYHLEGYSIISTAGKLNVDYEASDRIWFGRGWIGGEATIRTNGGNVTFHGAHFVGVNGTIDAGQGQVYFRAEDPTVGPDYGVWLFGNTYISGSKITWDSPLPRKDPGVRIHENYILTDLTGTQLVSQFPDMRVAGSTPMTIPQQTAPSAQNGTPASNYSATQLATLETRTAAALGQLDFSGVDGAGRPTAQSPYTECTTFAKSIFDQISDVALPSVSTLHDAMDWYSNVPSNLTKAPPSTPIDQIPIGAIVVWGEPIDQNGAPITDTPGHVAVVIANDGNKLTVVEDNWDGHGIVDKQVLTYSQGDWQLQARVSHPSQTSTATFGLLGYIYPSVSQ